MKIKTKILISTVSIIFALSVMVLSAHFALAQTTQQLDVSGYILNNENKEIPNGDYEIRFVIYSGDQNVWQENQTVAIYNGIFNAYLGSVNPLPDSLDFNEREYDLGIKIGKDSEMAPRKKIGAVPIAINSRYLQGEKIGTKKGDILQLGKNGEIDIDRFPTGTKKDTLALGNDDRFHNQNTDTGTDFMEFNIGNDTALSGNNFDIAVSEQTAKPTLRFNGTIDAWQFSNDGTIFSDVGSGSAMGNYLLLAGGTMTGDITFSATQTFGGATLTELGYVDGVTGSIQTQLDGKAETKADVGLGSVENTALSTWAGTTNITTLGTISTGTWNGAAVTTAYGGTGLASYVAGDMLYYSSGDTLTALGIGSDGQILRSLSGVPVWGAPIVGAAHNLLSLTHTDTTADNVLRGDLITGQDSGGGVMRWQRLAVGNSGRFLGTDGTDITWNDTTDITQLGTITVGTWNADAIANSYVASDLTLAGATIGTSAITLVQSITPTPVNEGVIEWDTDNDRIVVGDGATQAIFYAGAGAGGVTAGAGNTINYATYWSAANEISGEAQLAVSRGGTNSTDTPDAGAIVYGTGTAYAFNTAGSAGQALISGGTGAPTWTAGTLTLAGNFITSGAGSLTLTTSGATNVTLPTTGTLATLAGTETLTNKTMSTGSTWQGNVIADAYIANDLTLAGATIGTSAITLVQSITPTPVNEGVIEWDTDNDRIVVGDGATQAIFYAGAGAGGVTAGAGNTINYATYWSAANEISGEAQLAVSRGGTNSTDTPDAGAIVYGTGTAYAFNTAGSAGQALISGGTGAPTWTAGTLTLAGNFITSGAGSLTLTTSGATNVTLPTTGTLATLAGTETLTNKTMSTGSTWQGNVIADAYIANDLTLAGATIGTSAITLVQSITPTPVNEGVIEWDTDNDRIVVGDGATQAIFYAGAGAGGVTAGAGNTINYATYWSAANEISGEAQLAVSRGGTNSTDTPDAGAIVYGTGTAYAFNTAGSAGQALISGGTGAPTWTAGTLTLAGNFITSGAGSLTLTTSGATNVTLPTTGTLATLAGTETLTNKTMSTGSTWQGNVIADAYIANDLTLAGATIGTSAITLVQSITPTPVNEGVIEWDTDNDRIVVGDGATQAIFYAGAGAGGVTAGAGNTINYATYWSAANEISGEAQLAVSRGGTNSTDTPDAGAIVYGTGTAYAFNTAGSAGQALISGGTGAPTWTAGTLTLAGNFITSGAGSLTLTTSGATNVTLPTTGTLATLAGTETLTNKTMSTGSTWQGNVIADAYIANDLTLAGATIGTSAITLVQSITPTPVNEGVIEWDTDNDRIVVGDGATQAIFYAGAGAGGVTAGAGNTINYATYWSAANEISGEAQLAVSRGGTNSTDTPDAGAIVYGTGTAYAFNTAGSAGQALISGGTGAPTWTAGTLTLAGNFITSGAGSLTLTTSGATNVTLPTTGTLATLAGTETLTNKTMSTGSTWQGNAIGTTYISNDSLLEVDLNITNEPTGLNGYILSLDETSGGFTWINNTGGSGASKWSDSGTYTYLTNTADDLVLGSTATTNAKFFFDVSDSSTTFEGSTDDEYETKFVITDPTADNTITFPNASGTLVFSGGAGSSKWTNNGSLTYLTETGDDMVAGGSDLSSPFSVDVSANIVRIGDATAAGNAILNMYASDGTTGSITYNTNDAWAFEGGNIGIGDTSPLSLFTVGDTDLFQVNSSGAIAAAAGITSSGAITFSGISTDGVVKIASGALSSEAQLALARGGTNANLTAINGGIVYSGASALSISTAGSAGQALISGGTGAPTWTAGTLTLAGNFITSGAGSLTLTTSGATNVTLPTTGTLATLAGTETLTNKTMSTGSTWQGNVIADAYIANDLTLAGATIGTSAITLVQSITPTPVNEGVIEWDTDNDRIVVGDGATQAIFYAGAGAGGVTAGAGNTINYATYWSAANEISGEAQLAVSRGGTNSTDTPDAGAIVYGTGTAYAFNTAGSAGQALISGGTGAPTWTAGTLTLAGNFITSGAGSLTLTTSGATNVTLPTTGTLATLAGTETLTNKTMSTGSTWQGNVIADAYIANDLTLAGATIGTSAITLVQSITPTPVNEGVIEWDTDNDRIVVGDGATQAIFYAGAGAGGVTAGAGNTINYATYWSAANEISGEAQLAVSRGGTNSTDTPDAGAIVYGTGTAYAFNTAGSAGQALISGGTGAPTWTAGTLTLAGNFITSGAGSLTLTTSGATNVTLPTTGTLATLAGTETLTNKTMSTGSTWQGNVIADAYIANDLTLAGATIGTSAITLVQSITPTPVNEGVIEWDTDNDRIVVGDGATQAIFYAGAGAGGVTAGAGNTINYATYWSAANEISGEAQLAVSRGGTNSTDTPDAGAIVYGTGTAYAFNTAGSAGQALISGGTGAPTWTAGTLTLAGNFITSGAGSLTLTTSGATNVTLPTTGTLATLAGTETLTNKTMSTGSTWQGNVIADAYIANDLTLAGATIGTSAITLVQSITPTPVNEGVIEWDTDNDRIVVGDGATQAIFYAGAGAGGVTAGAGNTINYATYWSAANEISGEAQLAVSRGGTNSTDTPDAGAIVYGTGTAYAFNTAGSAGQALISGGTGAPTWTAGTLTLAGNFITSGAGSLTLTTSGATNVTLPTTGTLATLAGTETLTNKTMSTGSTWQGNAIGIAYGGTGESTEIGLEDKVEAYIFDADAQNISGVWTWQDGINMNFGTGSDLRLSYDGTIDNRLEMTDGTNLLLGISDAGTVGNLFASGGISTYDNTVADGYGEFTGLCLGNGTNCITSWGSAGAIDGSGSAGYATYWVDANTLNGEPQLATSRGGTQIDTASSTGVATVSGGTWSILATLGDSYISALTGASQGDVLYHNGASWAKLGAGTGGQYLETQGVGANPQWSTVTTHDAVTLAGVYDYLTLATQQITLNQIDLTTDVSGLLPAVNGGTGLDGSSAANGTLLIGNGTGYTLATLTDGTGITVTEGAGSITIASTLGAAIDTTEITDDTILEADLDATNIASDGQVLTFDNATGGFAWSSAGSGGIGDITAVGDATTGDAFTAAGTGNNLYFEGTTIDAIETILTVVDPTSSDKTITLPNATGYTVLDGTICTDIEGTGLSIGSGTLNWSSTGLTWAGNTVAVGYGGTGITSYTIGDIIYASGVTTLSALADVAVGNVLTSGGVGVAPSWGKVDLTSHITGTLHVANGGTNSSTALNNDMVMVSSGGAIVESATITTTELGLLSGITGALYYAGGTDVATADGGTGIDGSSAANGTLLIGNGTGYTLATLTDGTGITITEGVGSITIASTLGTSVDLTSEVTGILPLANGGTNADLTAVNGGIVYSGASALAISAAGTSGQALISGGTSAPTWFAPTAGSILFAGASGILSQDNANFFWDSGNHRLGIGTLAPSSDLEIYSSIANPFLTITGAHNTDYDPMIKFRTDASPTVKFSMGVDAGDSDKFKIYSGDGIGGTSEFTIDTSGTTSISNLELGAQSFETNAGAVGWIDMPVTNVAAINTVESYTAMIDGNGLLTIYAESDGAGGIQDSGVGIGTTTPTAYLHIKAGTTAAGTSPLKFTSGTNLASAEAGAIEFDGTDLYYTTSVPTRRTIVNTAASQTLTNKTLSTGSTWNGTAIGAQYGGTGLDGSSAANGTLLIGNGTGYTLAILTDGTGITITEGAGSITIASTLGTSVDLTSEVTGILPLANGGTNADLTAVNGGIVYSGASALAISAAGTSGQALISGGTGAPSWFAPTAGSILFAGTNGILNQDNSNFFWDDTNDRLGIGTAAPSAQTHIVNNINVALTGTVAVNAGNNYVTGSSTLFLTELSAGDLIKIAGESFTVSAVYTNTGLLLSSNHSAGASGVTAYTGSDIFRIVNGLGETKIFMGNNGYVGINTASPTAALDADGFIVFNKSGTSTADFVFGSPQLADDGNTDHDMRMWFDKSKGAFRAGYVQSTQWDDGSVGNYSFASGQGTIASVNTSTAMGSGTTASGSSSTAMGSGTTASGSSSTAMGSDTTASGSSSTAMGYYTTAQAYNSLVLGRWNVISGTTDSWVDTEPLFVVGIGTGSGARANALTLLKNGKLGLGEATPTAYLHLKAGTATAGDAPIKLTSGTNLATPEAGAMEFDGTNLYFTPSAVRKTIAFTDSAMTGTFDGVNLNIGNQGGLAYYSASGTMSSSAAGTTGQALISGGTGAPTWYTPTAGSILFAGASGILSQDNANFFWDSGNHRLGIGTLAPDELLEIYGTSNKLKLSYDDTHYATLAAESNGTLKISSSNTGESRVKIGSGIAEDTLLLFDGSAQDYYAGLDDTDDAFKIGLGSVVGTTPYMTILSGGNVGIGTETPGAILDIDGGGGSTTGLEISNLGTATRGIDLSNSGLSGDDYFIYGNANSYWRSDGALFATVGYVRTPLYYDSDDTAYYLDPANTGNSLLVAGNVGIGIVTPSAKLDIDYDETSTTVGSFYGMRSDTDSTGIFATAAQTSYIYGIYGDATASGISTAGTVNTYGGYFTATGEGTGAATTNAYGLYVNGATGADNNYSAAFMNGNVGIGTATPEDKLYIEGTSGITQVTIAANSGGTNAVLNVHSDVSDNAYINFTEEGVTRGSIGLIGAYNDMVMSGSADLTNPEIYIDGGNNYIGLAGDLTPDAHLEVTANGTTGGNIFLLSSNDDLDGDLMTVTKAGLVGIGIVGPAANLHVVNNEASTVTAQGLLLHLDNDLFTGSSSTAANNGGGLVITADKAANSDFDFIAAISDVDGTDDAEFRVTGEGEVYGDGASYNSGADYAEFFHTKDIDLASGELVCIDVSGDNEVARCSRERDNNVIGIISTNPAFVGNNIPGADANLGEIDESYKLVGLIGQVLAKATTQNGRIRVGDSLTSSSIPGRVMKADPGDSTVGVALENLSSDKGVINVLISRRNKSLTVEKIEDQITDRIAQMEIEDEVNILISQAVDSLDFEAEMSVLENRITNIESNPLFSALGGSASGGNSPPWQGGEGCAWDINSSLIADLQEQMDLIQEENNALIDFMLSVETGRFVKTDEDGNVDLLDGKLEAGEIVAGAFTVKIADEENRTIGSVVIVPITTADLADEADVTDTDLTEAETDENESETDLTDDDGRSVFVETKAVSETCKIFTSFENNPGSSSWVEKTFDEESDDYTGFKILLSEPVSEEVKVNWWIIESAK